MNQKDNILQELNELQSSLANASSQNVYKIPEGYFENLSDQVLNHIKALEAETVAEELSYLSSLVSSISKKVPYSVPAGFFEELDEKIIHAVKDDSDLPTPAEELEMLSPLLSGLKKEMPYSIPEDYFKNVNLSPAIKPQAKVVSITRQKWFRYAAAAVVTGFIVMSGFLIFKNDKIDPRTQSSEWVNKNLKKVSTDDINTFVQSVTEETPVIASSNAKNEIENDVRELIKDIPDKEIQDFLDETQPEETDSDVDLLLN